METDKLAAELIEPYLMNLEGYPKIRFISQESCLEAMQVYHKARLKEITDADIEAACEKYCEGISIAQSVSEIAEAYIESAKAILNGEMKHNEK